MSFELSTLTTVTVQSQELDGAKLDGVSYRVRMPSGAHHAHIKALGVRSIKAVPRELRDALKDGRMSEIDAADAMTEESVTQFYYAVPRLFLRTCLISIDGVTVDGGAIQIVRDASVDIGGVSVIAMNDAQLTEMESGALGDDLAALGTWLYAQARLDPTEKKR